MKTRPSSGLSGQEFRVGLGPAGSCGRCTGGSGGCRERQATLPWGGPSGPQPGPGPECLQVASRLRGGHGGGRSTSVLRARVRLWEPLGPGRGSCPPAHELWGAGLPRAQQSVPWRRVPPCLSPAVTRGGEVSLPPTHLGGVSPFSALPDGVELRHGLGRVAGLFLPGCGKGPGSWSHDRTQQQRSRKEDPSQRPRFTAALVRTSKGGPERGRGTPDCSHLPQPKPLPARGGDPIPQSLRRVRARGSGIRGSSDGGRSVARAPPPTSRQAGRLRRRRRLENSGTNALALSVLFLIYLLGG